MLPAESQPGRGAERARLLLLRFGPNRRQSGGHDDMAIERLARTGLTRRRLLGSAAAAIGTAIAPRFVRAQGGTGRIIVSGASGRLGGLTVAELIERGVEASRLILVSRTPETLERYAAMGASVRFGDFTKPESLPAAYAGGTRMLLISIGGSPEDPAPAAHKRAIDAAKAAGVRLIAYTSYVGIPGGDTAGRAADHLETEEVLKASGVAWTMLRNSIYMDRLVGEAAQMIAAGRAIVPRNEHKIGYITRADCGAAAAAVLSTPGHENTAYEITGPELVGVRETAAAASA